MQFTFDDFLKTGLFRKKVSDIFWLASVVSTLVTFTVVTACSTQPPSTSDESVSGQEATPPPGQPFASATPGPTATAVQAVATLPVTTAATISNMTFDGNGVGKIVLSPVPTRTPYPPTQVAVGTYTPDASREVAAILGAYWARVNDMAQNPAAAGGPVTAQQWIRVGEEIMRVVVDSVPQMLSLPLAVAYGPACNYNLASQLSQYSLLSGASLLIFGRNHTTTPLARLTSPLLGPAPLFGVTTGRAVSPSGAGGLLAFGRSIPVDGAAPLARFASLNGVENPAQALTELLPVLRQQMNLLPDTLKPTEAQIRSNPALSAMFPPAQVQQNIQMGNFPWLAVLIVGAVAVVSVVLVATACAGTFGVGCAPAAGTGLALTSAAAAALIPVVVVPVGGPNPTTTGVNS